MSDFTVRWKREARLLIIAGVPTGAIVVGLGSRAAMFVLRLTSPKSVRGITSDDGFEIGRFTLSGTVNLLMLGAAVGVIGAGTYRLVSQWLIGPQAFRRLTVGAAAGAVGGSMLVHESGVDFNVLKPTWLAIGLFVLLPCLFAISIGHVVDLVQNRASTSSISGRSSWRLPALLLLCFPLALPVVVLVLAVLSIAISLGEVDIIRRLRGNRLYGLAVRASWLSVACVGLVALAHDIRALT